MWKLVSMGGEKNKIKKARSGVVQESHIRIHRHLTEELIGDQDQPTDEQETGNKKQLKKGSNRDIATAARRNRGTSNEDSDSADEFRPQGDISVKQLTVVIAISSFTALILLDFLLYDHVLINSASYIVPLQTSLTAWVFAKIGYYLPLIGIALFLHFYLFFNSHSLHSVYAVFQLMVPLTLVVLLKSIYYRGRPFVVAPDVQGCDCSPGMPSGHATMSVSLSIVIYRSVDFHWLRFASNALIVKSMTVMCLTIVCVLVGVSRLVTGSHDLWQLFVGSVVAGLCGPVCRFDLFKEIMRSLAHVVRPVSGCIAVLLIIVAYGFYFINHKLRDDNEDWKYWEKCEDNKCYDSFSGGMIELWLLCLFFPFYFLFCRFKTERGKKDPKEDHNLYIDASPGVGYKRSLFAQYFFYLTAHIPIILIYLPYILIPCGSLECYVGVSGPFWTISMAYLAFIMTRMPNQKPAIIAPRSTSRLEKTVELV